jgi:transposase
MEACYFNHYWARLFTEIGHEVKLIPAQHVKPFMRGNKNDHNDALAIVEATQRPNIEFVNISLIKERD